jgi:excisionase family DNA binding protein
VTLDDLVASDRAAWTVTDVAKLLDLDERTVRRAAADGQLPCIHVGRRLLIPRLPLIALLGGVETPNNSAAASTKDAAHATTEPVEGATHHGIRTALHAV